jgi:LPS export ABC transporter protein LptC
MNENRFFCFLIMISEITKGKSLSALPLRQTAIPTQATIDRIGKADIHINFLLVSAFILSCLFFSGCENDPNVLKAWTEKKVMVETGKNIESYLSQEGQVKAKLIAPLMYRYEADTLYTEFPKKLHVDFYDDSTKVETWVDSKHGKYFENLNKVYLWDSVVVINVKGDTLKSNDLWWDQNRKLFYTENYAEYRTKDKQIYPGKGLEATEDFKSIIFKQPIGTVDVSDTTFSPKSINKSPT